MTSESEFIASLRGLATSAAARGLLDDAAVLERAAADRAFKPCLRHNHARARAARGGAFGGEDGDERCRTLRERLASLRGPVSHFGG